MGTKAKPIFTVIIGNQLTTTILVTISGRSVIHPVMANVLKKIETVKN
jgi:hypothetical protein